MESVLPNRATATWLRVASNIDLTADGFIRRRRGFSRALSGQGHSLWADELNAYGVRNGELVRIDHRTLEVTVVVAGVGSESVSYARLPHGMVYWTNARRIGRLDNAAARELVTLAPNPVPVAVPTAGSLPPGRYQVCFHGLALTGSRPARSRRRSCWPMAAALDSLGWLLRRTSMLRALMARCSTRSRVATNDVNGDLASLYWVVTHHLEAFVRQFKWALTSRQVFKWLQETRPETLTDVQRAA